MVHSLTNTAVVSRQVLVLFKWETSSSFCTTRVLETFHLQLLFQLPIIVSSRPQRWTACCPPWR